MWRRLVEFAAFIAVPPALFYILGLGALWIQLSSEYDSSGLYNTWYAASLVPRSVAAGYGAGVIWRGIVISSGLAFLLLFVAYLVIRSRGSDRIQLGGYPLWIPLILPMILATIALLLGAAGYSESIVRVPAFRLVGGILVAYFLWFYLFWSLGMEGRTFLKMVFSYYPKGLYNVIAVVSILCVGASVLFPGDGSLPCLWREPAQGDVVDGKVLSPERAEELKDFRTLEGGFLAHSEGYWYVFDEKEVRAIPDDEATRIVEGKFYIAHKKIGEKAEPVGDEVAKQDFKAGETYTPVPSCE